MLGKTQRGRFWLTLLLLVLLGLAAAILLRKDIAAWTLTSALEVRGLEVGGLSVTQLGWRRTSVRGLALEGPGLAVELKAIDLDYRPLDLLSGEWPAVSLAEGELAIDHQSPWLKDQFENDKSTPAPEASSSESPSSEILPTLPDVTITDVLLRLTTPAGPLDVAVDGSLRQAPERALAGSFRLNAKSTQGQSLAVTDFTLAPDRSLAAELRLEEGGFDVGKLSLKGVTGRASIAFDAARRKLEAFEVQLQLSKVSGAVSPSVALAPLRIALDAGLEQEDVIFDLAVKTDRSQQQPAQAEIRGRVVPGAEGLSLDVSSRIDSPADLPFFSQFLVPLPHAGFLTGRAEVRALLPPAAELQAMEVWALPPTSWIQVFQAMETEFSLQTEGLSHRDYVEGLTSELSGRAVLDDSGMELRLAKPATAELVALSDAVLESLTLPEDLREWVAGSLALSLVPKQEQALLSVARSDILTGPYEVAAALDVSGANFSLSATPGGDLRPDQRSWSLTGPLSLQARKLPLRGITGARGLFDLDLQGDLASDAAGTSVTGDLKAAADEVVKDDVSLTGVRASIPLRGEVSAQAFHFQTTALATASLQGLSSAAIKSTDALKLDIPHMDMTLDLATGRPRPSLSARLAPAAFALMAEGEPLPLVTEAVDLELSPTEKNGGLFLLQLNSKGVSLPVQQLRVANIAVSAEADPESGAGGGLFEDLTIEDRAEVPRFEPVTLKGNFRRDTAGRLDFAAQGHSFQDAVTFDVKGDSRPGGDPRAEVTLPPHDFAVTPLKLSKLSWISDALVDQGRFSGKLQVEMSQEGPVGLAEFSGDGLSGKLLGFPFSGLSLAMDLDGLWPPETTRPITINLAELNPGLAIRDLQLQASFPPASAFTLDLPAAAFTLLGARISLAGGRLALLEGKADLPIRITGLDLAEVLKAADFEDIDVTGQLSGDLPVSFEEGRVTLRSSKLAATEPGVLRVRSDEVASLLTGYGDEVNSMLRALEDFYYDDLSLTLAKTADDDLTLLLSILGQNPAVLEGQPFRINLNLESNIGQILNTLGEGLEISKDLLSGRYSLQ